LPIPHFAAAQFPEVKARYDKGLGDVQYTFWLDGSRLSEIFKGSSPFNDGTTLRTAERPEQGYPLPAAPERLEEFALGLTPTLIDLAQAAAKMAAR